MSDSRERLSERRRIAAERAAARRVAQSKQRTRRYWVVGGIAGVLAVVGVLGAVALRGGDDGDDGDDDAAPTATLDANDPLAPILAKYASGECPQPADGIEWQVARLARSTPATQSTAEAQIAAWDAACGLGKGVPDQGRGHIAEGAAHEPYSSVPPTSGPHYGGLIAPWGVSTQPIPDEVQVHNLEHGGVMLQYNCACPEAIAILERFANPATGYPTKIVAAPYHGMPSEIALTAWGRIWTMTAAELSEARVRAFIDGYVDRGPETISSETEQLEAWREEQS